MRVPKRSGRTRGGFTLIELMIVAALIGVLSAIAIPNFVAFQARGRRAEAYTNLASLAHSYVAYGAEQGSYPDMLDISTEASLPDWTAYPQGLGTTKLPWDGQTQTYFDIVGWQSEGAVFYSYDVNTTAGCTCTFCFTATAHGDVDGDGHPGAVIYVHPQRSAAGGIGGDCPSRVSSYLPQVGPGGVLYDQPAVVTSPSTIDDF